MNKKDTLNQKKGIRLVDKISEGDAGTRYVTTHFYPRTKWRSKQIAISVTETTDYDEDIETLGRFNRSDAEVIIRQLRSAFDIPDEERQMVDLLQNQLDASQELIENLSAVTVANIMYENGLRTAVLTPSRIVSGLTPALEIDATRPDQVKYILKEEPLNAQDTTDNGRLDS